MLDGPRRRDARALRALDGLPHGRGLRARPPGATSRALVLIGPVTLGLPPPDEALEYWDAPRRRASRAAGWTGSWRPTRSGWTPTPEWRDTVLRFTRERMELHRHPEAVAAALRELPRSIPFEGIAELESLDVPALVVGSRDEADPQPSLRGRRGLGRGDPGRDAASARSRGSRRSPGRAGSSRARSRTFCRASRGSQRGAEYPSACGRRRRTPIHYSAVERGTPVFSSDGVEVGTVDQVVDNYREHILDGFVIETSDGKLRFADAPEVARTTERAVTLTIDAAAVERAAAARQGRSQLQAEPRRPPVPHVRRRLAQALSSVPRGGGPAPRCRRGALRPGA